MEKIKFGVSLYSYSAEFYTKKYSLEQCMQSARDAGATALEIVAEQMVPGYPFPDKKWLRNFRDMCYKMELDPFCYSIHCDIGLRSDRLLTQQELFDYHINCMRDAVEMGATAVRTQQSCSPEVYRKLIPWAEKFGIRLGIETHPPYRIDAPLWVEYLKIFKEADSFYAGAIPDFGIFREKPNEQWLDVYRRRGMKEDIMQEVLAQHQQGMEEKLVLERLKKDKADDTTLEYAGQLYKFFAPYDEATLRKLLQYTVHFHSKFFNMQNGEEDTIPFAPILKVIGNSSYDGYLMSEYEGHAFTHDTDIEQQMRDHIAMERRYLGYTSH